jgi:hypothetical protein
MVIGLKLTTQTCKLFRDVLEKEEGITMVEKIV